MRRLETVRRDFVANVSHELRTPVAVIRANAETLLAGAKDDPQMAAKLIDGLHRNAERLARILADLLDLSRLDAGQYRLELAPVPVRVGHRAVADRGRAAGAEARASTVAVDDPRRARASRADAEGARSDPRQPDRQRRQVHAGRGPRVGRGDASSATRSGSRSATTAPASPTSTASACSSGSIAPIRAARARPAAPASACRSSSTSSRAWAARSASSRTRRAAASSGCDFRGRLQRRRLAS